MPSIQWLPNPVNKIGEFITGCLSDAHVCARCIVRFLGDRTTEIHSALDHPSIKPEAKPCPACLGLLQINHSQVAQQMQAEFEVQKYQMDKKTFCVATQLPSQLLIRHKAIILHIDHLLKASGLLNPLLTNQVPKPAELRDVFKHLIINAFQNETNNEFQYLVDSPLMVTLAIDHQETMHDYKFLETIPSAKFNYSLKKQMRCVPTDVIAQTLTRIGYDEFKSCGQVPPYSPSSMASVISVSYCHSQLYVAGRYCKLQRGISNSPWLIGGKRLTEHSVEDLIGKHLDEHFRVSSHKFASAGREDADVLMLGTGRPFYFELVNARNTACTSQKDLTSLQEQMNLQNKGLVSVCDLQMISRDDTSVLKDSASTKSKSYDCLVQFGSPVDPLVLEGLSKQTNIAIAQKNPTRVPRRADLLRHKTIETIAFTPKEGNSDKLVMTAMVHLKTSAGTYVKEFVHGDDGRTVPCLASLLSIDSAKVLELDVTEIHLDWPNQINV